jgi:Fungal protein kinase
MAVDLIAKPDSIQTVEHDLESFFWVLLWLCLSYFDTSISLGLRTSIVKATMSPRAYGDTGGLDKMNFMANRLALQYVNTRTSPTVAKVLKTMHFLLGTRHTGQLPASDLLLPKTSPTPDRTQSETQHASEGVTSSANQKVTDKYKSLLKLLHNALAENMWHDDDGPVPQEFVLSQEETSAFWSGSKRSRSVAERMGALGPLSGAKRLELA